MLVKEIRVCARAFERDGAVCDTVDQDPIRTDMAIPMTLPFARQLVIPVALIQGLLGDEEFHDRPELRHVVPALLASLVVAFELSGA